MTIIILLNLSPDLIKDKYVSCNIKSTSIKIQDIKQMLTNKFGVELELYRIDPELKLLPDSQSINGVDDLLTAITYTSIYQILGFKVAVNHIYNFNITQTTIISYFDDIDNFINMYTSRYNKIFNNHLFNLAVDKNKPQIIDFMLKLEYFDGMQIKRALAYICNSNHKYLHPLAIRLYEMLLKDPIELDNNYYISAPGYEDGHYPDYDHIPDEISDRDFVDRSSIHYEIYNGAFNSGWWDIAYWASDLPENETDDFYTWGWWDIDYWRRKSQELNHDNDTRAIIERMIYTIENDEDLFSGLLVYIAGTFSDSIYYQQKFLLGIAFRIGSPELVKWVGNVNDSLKLSNLDMDDKNFLLQLTTISNVPEMVQMLIDFDVDLRTFDVWKNISSIPAFMRRFNINYDMIKILLANGANINTEGLVNIFINNGQDNIVCLLIEYGVKIDENLREHYRNICNHPKVTSLQQKILQMIARQEINPEELKKLPPGLNLDPHNQVLQEKQFQEYKLQHK